MRKGYSVVAYRMGYIERLHTAGERKNGYTIGPGVVDCTGDG